MRLTPYVPRVVLQWAQDYPDTPYRRLPGSLAFCDLSGFTAMSEKLAALGRLGAEELADVLNLLFSALLDDAAAYGGSLLKYGGDAVLLFFEGDDHPARAAAATHRMRATLRRLGTIRTSRGIVRVKMSVGVHTGAFDFFLVGDDHLELIVAGEGATITVDTEGAAEAGDILLSAAMAAALPASCVGDAKGDGFLLKRAPRTPARDPEAWGDVPDIDATPFVPVGQREHVGGIGADAEHRHIAVGFVAFGGVDHLLGERGGDETAAVLHNFVASCQAAFARYNVTFLYADIYGDGGKVFFISGAPVAHEDNEERLLRAALDISAADHGLHLHTGLNRGYVFAGDIGSATRRTYTVLGDAVNTAARVMASCDADNQVRSMPDVVNLASSRYATEAQAPFAAKGKALPLETVAVGAPLGPRRSDVQLPLIGREAELAQFRDFIASASRGQGEVVALTGEAGVGKSRLVEAVREEAAAAGFATLATFAERYEQTNIYFVLRQLLSAALGDEHLGSAETCAARAAELAPNHVMWLPLLQPVLKLDFPATEEVNTLSADAVTQVLGQLTLALLDGAFPDPAIWVAENAHLVDEASVGVIATVAAQVARRPWLVIMAGRDDGAAGLGTLANTTISLTPLDADNAVRLARLADPTILPHDAATVAERSNGNPLFLRELITANRAGATITDSVETTVTARIDRLNTVDREVLRTAAVLGGRFDHGALRELLGGQTPDLAALADFLTPMADSVVFREGLYREVAYEGLTFRRRRALHHAAGRLLESDDVDDNEQLARLSLHFHCAQDWTASWKYSQAAAAQAATTAAKSVAASYFERALEAGRHLPDVDGERLAELAVEMGLALYNAGRGDEALAAYRQARRFAPPGTVTRADVDAHESLLWLREGAPKKAVSLCVRGLDALDHAPGSERASGVAMMLMLGLADARLRLGQFADAYRLAAEVTALGESIGAPDHEAQAHSLHLAIAYRQGDYVAALEAGEAAVAAMRRDARYGGSIAAMEMNVGVIKLALGDWAGSDELFSESCAVHAKLGNDAQWAMVKVNIAEMRVDQGRWDDASEALDECKPVLARSAAHVAAYAHLVRVVLQVRRNGFEGYELPGVANHPTAADLVHRVRVEAALLAGDARAAAAELKAADDAGVIVGLRAIFGARIAQLSGGALGEITTESAFEGVLARVAAGATLADDHEAHRLGIVAVPAWLVA